MVCSLPASAGFQPRRPTASRMRTKPSSRVSSRRKCVWPSMMNCPARARARSSAISGVAASAALTPKSGPNTSLRATKPAAMPAAVAKNLRRDMP